MVCVAVHLVMFIVLAAAPVLQFSTSFSMEHVEKSVFRAEWENSPPEVSAFSSAYVYQWLMTAALHWQTRQQQKHQKDRQKKRKQNLKEREEQKATYCTRELELGLIELENFGVGVWGGDGWVWLRTRESNRGRAKEQERECRTRPGLETRLCLCLGLIDFPENCCSRPLPSSLMKPSGICHPTTRPTPALHCSTLPPSSFFHSLLLRQTHSHTHIHSIANKRTHAYTGTERNYLSYTGGKQRISKAHVPCCCLCICSLFGVLFGRISALSLNKEKKKLS